MPRIRTIKPEFWSDEKLAPMPVETRFLFLALICMADDCGRLVDSVSQIVAFMHPYADDESFASASRAAREGLANLSGAARIRRGETASGQRVIQIVNWSRHQRVDHPNTKAALPEIVATQEDAIPREGFARDSRGIREALASNSRDDLRPTTYDLRPSTVDLPRETASTTTAEAVAVAEQIADALALVPCTTDHQRHAVREFLCALPTGQRPSRWAAWLAGLLEGLGMPGGKPATADDLAVGLSEFLSEDGRDVKQRFVVAFIADAKRRRERVPSPPTPASDAPAGPVVYSQEYCERRSHFWTSLLLTNRCWAYKTPRQQQDDMPYLRQNGYIPDEAQFLAEWQVVAPLVAEDRLEALCGRPLESHLAMFRDALYEAATAGTLGAAPVLRVAS